MDLPSIVDILLATKSVQEYIEYFIGITPLFISPVKTKGKTK
jgi:hypothetical protein